MIFEMTLVREEISIEHEKQKDIAAPGVLETYGTKCEDLALALLYNILIIL